MIPNSLQQKINRLQAMSLPEVFYRLRQFRYDNRERSRLADGRAAESVELFVAKLAGNAPSLEEKFGLVFQQFRERNVFNWQQSEPSAMRRLLEEHFPTSRENMLQAAEQARRGEFKIFNLTCDFSDGIDWHYDPLAKKSLPLKYWRDVDYYSPEVVREVKYIWELNRCQHFVTLGKAYYLTGDEKWEKALLGQWLDWIAKNPYQMGVNWCSALECAFRLVSWTWALYFIQQSAHLNAGLYARLLQAIRQHVLFIRNHLSKYSSANNHLVGEALGLIYAGCYFPEFAEAQEWRHAGFSILFDEIQAQVYDDGVSKEQTSFYQAYIFEFGLLAVLAAEQANVVVPPKILHRLEKMAEFYAAIIDENGNIPHIGDDDGGQTLRLAEEKSNPYRSLLATAAAFFNRGDFKSAAKNLGEETLWLLGEASVAAFHQLDKNADDQNEANLKDSSSSHVLRLTSAVSHFPDGGYVILAPNGTEPQKLVFDIGPLGLGTLAAHGHADALSFTLSVKGQPVLIDSGTWLYKGAGEERRYFRSTAAHNTITIDGRDQSEQLGLFQWGRRAECFLHEMAENGETLRVRAWHDGYKKLGVTHTREIVWENGAWLITDLISGVGKHQIDAYFHLAPCQVRLEKNGAYANFSGCEIEIDCSLYNNKIEIKEAWFSESFGERRLHPVVHLALAGPLPVELRTRISVYGKTF